MPSIGIASVEVWCPISPVDLYLSLIAQSLEESIRNKTQGMTKRNDVWFGLEKRGKASFSVGRRLL